MISMPVAGPTLGLGRLLRLPLRLVPDGATVRILTGPISGGRWISGSHTHGCWLGTYERGLQRRIWSALEPGQTFYDVGANVGFFSLLAAAAVGPAGSVVAFEPLPRNLALLRRHLDLNHVRHAVVVPAAVADASGTADLETSGGPAQSRLGREGVRVDLVTLDAFVRSGGPPPQVVKIDVEGAETRVLAGARDLLARHAPLLFLSTHGYRRHEECRSFLEGAGYRFEVTRDGAADGNYEVIATPRPRARSSSA